MRQVFEYTSPSFYSGSATPLVLNTATPDLAKLADCREVRVNFLLDASADGSYTVSLAVTPKGGSFAVPVLDEITGDPYVLETTTEDMIQLPGPIEAIIATPSGAPAAGKGFKFYIEGWA